MWNVHVGIRAVLELGLPDSADDTDDLPLHALVGHLDPAADRLLSGKVSLNKSAIHDCHRDAACIVMVLERDDAIPKWRDLMGATDPAKAAAGTIRKDFAASIEANAVHGSDAPETAAFEIPYFFSALELCPR